MTPKYIAARLTRRQRDTLAWLIEDWPWPYRGQPTEDVRELVSWGLLNPPTEDEWGDATLLGREVWKHARPTWLDEHKLGARFGIRVSKSNVLEPFKRSGKRGLGDSFPKVSRAELEKQTKLLYAEAHAADPHYVEEQTVEITGAESFAWQRLTLKELQALRRRLYVVVMQARG